MNAKERGEWLKALRSCFPDLNTVPLAEFAASADGPGHWEASVRGGGLDFAGLRYFGTGDYAAWSEACAKGLNLSGERPKAPGAGLPWLAATWNLKTGTLASARLCARGQAFEYGADGKLTRKLTLAPKPFKAGAFGEPALDQALSDFSALCPVATLSLEDPGWSLRLKSGVRWPLFARCDISAAFTPLSSQQALFLLDRRVVELSFDGEALWAHCAG